MNRTEYEKKLFQDIILDIKKHDRNNHISSIILTGSFGRNEPTYIICDDGKFQLKSDIEIAIVFRKATQKNAINQLITEVSENFEENLNLMAINERRVKKAYNFNFALKIPKYKTIFTYDLYNGSKTIWGHDFISEMKIQLPSVDIYEAKRLVANRIGELIYSQYITDEHRKDFLRKYWKGKLVLAIASAWLICEGEYVSSYHGQYNKIRRLVRKVENQVGKEFVKEYERVFDFLRDNGPEYEVTDKVLRGYVKKISEYFAIYGIKKTKINCSSRKVKYYVKYLKTGMKYGLIGFEDKILQALITDYYEDNPRLDEDAGTWYKVLY